VRRISRFFISVLAGLAIASSSTAEAQPSRRSAGSHCRSPTVYKDLEIVRCVLIGSEGFLVGVKSPLTLAVVVSLRCPGYKAKISAWKAGPKPVVRAYWRKTDRDLYLELRRSKKACTLEVDVARLKKGYPIGSPNLLVDIIPRQ
jgi:hypothetical protein